ncbi:MAG: hypothetical protein WD120_00400, partial [Gemmatimonadota bacterium]
MRHPQFIDILGIRILRCSSHVHVEIHESGKHVAPMGVDLASGTLGPAAVIDGNARVPDVGHLDDAVALDD